MNSAIKLSKKFFIVLIMLVNTSMYAFSVDTTKYLTDGNKYYQEYIVTKNINLLNKAYLNYYKASEIEPSVSSYLGMGMIFLEKKLYPSAKEYLYRAYSIDAQDATVNYYLGKYSELNDDYLRAIDYYKKAYDYGYANNYEVNYSLASMYEKVGDFPKAKKFYHSSIMLNANSEDPAKRLSIIEFLELNKSQYGQVQVQDED